MGKFTAYFEIERFQTVKEKTESPKSKENITKKTKKKFWNISEITTKKTKKNVKINAIWIVLIAFMMIALCRKTNNEKVVFKIEYKIISTGSKGNAILLDNGILLDCGRGRCGL